MDYGCQNYKQCLEIIEILLWENWLDHIDSIIRLTSRSKFGITNGFCEWITMSSVVFYNLCIVPSQNLNQTYTSVNDMRLINIRKPLICHFMSWSLTYNPLWCCQMSSQTKIYFFVEWQRWRLPITNLSSKFVNITRCNNDAPLTLSSNSSFVN